jgi:large subunit ribosomal protein L24
MHPSQIKEKRQVRFTKATIKQKTKFGGRIVVSESLVKPDASNLVPKCHVKKGDLVMVISGSKNLGKGKTGKVLAVFPKEGKVTVEGVNVQTRAVKSKGPMAKGGLVKEESPIFASKVMLYSQKSKKPVRKEFRKREDID